MYNVSIPWKIELKYKATDSVLSNASDEMNFIFLNESLRVSFPQYGTYLLIRWL